MYARIQAGRVAELLAPPAGATLAESFHPGIVAACVAVPAGATVAVGDSYADGEFGPASAPTVPASSARASRNALLAASDWTQMPDAPLSAPQRATWATYRQALRDWPDAPGWPDAPLPAAP